MNEKEEAREVKKILKWQDTKGIKCFGDFWFDGKTILTTAEMIDAYIGDLWNENS